MLLRTLLFLLIILSLSILGALIYAPGKIIEIYNQTRPKIISGGGDTCIAKLSQTSIKYTLLDDIREGQCLVKDPVRITKFSNTTISAPLILNCKTALKTDDWLNNIEAKHIDHFGTYNCRSMRGSNVASEHSFGTAIDIAAIDGASVQRDWDKETAKGALIRSAADVACAYFSNAITPEHNALHYDHLHLDMGYGTSCMYPMIRNLERLTLRIIDLFN
jgi:hypothetical protein